MRLTKSIQLCCAQRLSASTNQTPDDIGFHRVRITCSTPFGINESNTRSPQDGARFSVGVLNAFRHQRIKHAGTQNFRSLSERAQRLSASTNQTPADRCRDHRLRFVLNAFRHQRIKHAASGSATGQVVRCSTPFGINESNTVRDQGYVEGTLKCSTPFGINESNTDLRVVRLVFWFCAQRLSASTNQTHPE